MTAARGHTDIDQAVSSKVAGDIEYVLRRYGHLLAPADRHLLRGDLALLQDPAVDNTRPATHNAKIALRGRKAG